MKKLGQLFSFVFAGIWSFIPWRVNKLLGGFLAWLWIDIFSLRKKVIYDNLEIAFPNLSEDQKLNLARASMKSLCRSFFDVIKIPSLTDKWIDANVVFNGFENIDELKNQNKGLLFLTLHLGSGDLGAAVVSRRFWPTTLISKRLQNKFLDQFWFSLRSRSMTEFIDAHSQKNAYEILSALKRKRGILFVLDQFMGKPYGVESLFFGVQTGTAYGLALFAKKTQLPVIPLYTHWDEADRLQIYMSAPIDLKKDFSETNEEITNKFNLQLEKIIRQHPAHWMWVHRRWKKFE